MRRPDRAAGELSLLLDFTDLIQAPCVTIAKCLAAALTGAF